MATLLVVHHTPSPSTQAMLDAVVEGASDDALDTLDITVRPALTATEVDVFDADGVVLGTPANIGYMSGALKHFFDRIYYPCQGQTRGLAFGLYVHGNNDTVGAVRAVAGITTGLAWREVAGPVEVIGEPGAPDLRSLRDLGATVAAHAAGLI